MNNLDTSRFMGIFQVPAMFSVSLIGAGGIGALTAVVLAKMGIKRIHIFDDDQVDGINIATQFHRFSDVGIDKVFAVAGLIDEFAGEGCEVYAYPWRVGIGSLSAIDYSPLFISAVDSIVARQEIWTLVNSMPRRPQWYIDARMAALELHLFIVNMNDPTAVADYDRRLMSLRESDVPEVPCTEKSTTFLPGLASAQIGAAIMRILLGEEVSHWLIQNLKTNTIFDIKLGR